ncbi:YbaN family protein [Nitratireductor aquibiodomus]|uniref:Transmembrane protein (PGPGW) n=3 Tax=Nitratireductor aquibiodomus TaxID=204799 RepID=A0A1H4IN69_9HYPH|nr:hypothetical protein SAMN05216452_0265 [Nitratireductor aquibiodomus]
MNTIPAAMKAATAPQISGQEQVSLTSWSVDGGRSLKIAPAFEHAKRTMLLIMGLVMLLLAVIGAFLPVMPTTIFLILAGWFFARSSPALERKLLEHPKLGPVLRNWRDHGVMSRRAKLLAAGGIAFGYGVFILLYEPGLLLALVVGAATGSVAIWIAMRPEA